MPALCAAFGVSPAWVFKRTKRGAADPLPVFRIGARGVRFDPDKVFLYLRARERHRPDARLDSFDGIARVNGKGQYTLTRKRFQTGQRPVA